MPAFPKPFLIATAAVLVVILAGGGLVLNRVRQEIDRQQGAVVKASEGQAAGNFRLGDKLPDFTVQDAEGKPVRLSSFLDGEHFVVVNFHHPDCPCAANCGRLINEMEQEGYADQVKVVGILSSDTRDDRVLKALQTQIEQKEISFPVFFDHDQSVVKLLGATRTPEMWVLDKEGRIVFYGAPENSLFPGSPGHRYLLREAMAALQAGKSPEIARFDPIGCRIGGG